jgi:hypothetical protein
MHPRKSMVKKRNEIMRGFKNFKDKWVLYFSLNKSIIDAKNNVHQKSMCDLFKGRRQGKILSVPNLDHLLKHIGTYAKPRSLIKGSR